jgi:hypothetical protein
LMAYSNIEDQRRYAAAHYQANKEVYKARARAQNRKHIEDVKALLRSSKAKPCADCGVQYPSYVMQFDHPPGQKNFTIGGKGRHASITKIQREIALCQVVCANCHAMRTHNRRVQGSS